MHTFGQALRASSIQALNVEHLRLGDDGGVLLFAALHHCASLRELVRISLSLSLFLFLFLFSCLW